MQGTLNSTCACRRETPMCSHDRHRGPVRADWEDGKHHEVPTPRICDHSGYAWLDLGRLAKMHLCKPRLDSLLAPARVFPLHSA